MFLTRGRAIATPQSLCVFMPSQALACRHKFSRLPVTVATRLRNFHLNSVTHSHACTLGVHATHLSARPPFWCAPGAAHSYWPASCLQGPILHRYAKHLLWVRPSGTHASLSPSREKLPRFAPPEPPAGATPGVPTIHKDVGEHHNPEDSAGH